MCEYRLYTLHQYTEYTELLIYMAWHCTEIGRYHRLETTYIVFIKVIDWDEINLFNNNNTNVYRYRRYIRSDDGFN